MPILHSDTFDRVAGSLPSPWLETFEPATPSDTDISTDGDFATIDRASRHIAILPGTKNLANYASVWCKKPNASQNVGLVLRYVSAWQYYEVVFEQVGGNDSIAIYRGNGSALRVRVADVDISVWYADNVWTRLDAQVVGTTVRVWAGGFPEPLLEWTDALSTGGIGSCGILSTLNNAGGVGNVLWNDFCARDGAEGDDIYVDEANGTLGYGFGTRDNPELSIRYGLANIGARRTSRIRVLDSTLTKPGGANDALIYSDKFSGGALTFPDYDAANGDQVTAGDPNLIIESASSSGRTALVNNDDGAFFTVGNSATGILFRGFDYTQGGFAAFNERFIDTSLSTDDHSIGIHKCSWRNGNASSGNPAVRIRTFFERFDCRYCYAYINPAYAALHAAAIEFAVQCDHSPNLDFDFFLATGEMTYGIYFGQCGPPVDHTWRLDHMTIHDVQAPLLATNTIGIVWLDYARIDGSAIVKNSIIASIGGNPTVNGIDGLFAGGPYTGTTTASYNTYFNVTNPRGTFGFVLNGGNEIASFALPYDETSAPVTWQQAGGIQVAHNFLAVGADYDNADDSNPLLGGLVRGAIQEYVAAPATIQRRKASFCVRVIYDVGGLGYDLSDLLVRQRPLTQQKDILLRAYQASDTELEFADPEGIFVDTNPLSPFVDPVTGFRNWRQKPVRIEFLDSTGAILTTYLGFVLSIRAGANQGYMRLGNRFQTLFVRPLLANDAGRIEDDAGNAGTPSSPPVGATYIGDADIGPGCGIEEWTITFTGAAAFDVKGSVTGPDGSGTTGADFVSNTGNLILRAADWSGLPLTPGNSCKIRTVWRSSDATTTVELFEELLLSAQGGRLDPSDLDQTVDDLKGSVVDRAITGCVWDDPIKVIGAMEEVALHMLAVATEKANGLIGLYAYVPQVVSSFYDILCKDRELMSALTDSTPIYNEFRFAYGYDEVDREFDENLIWPTTDADNDSLIAYGERIPAPKTIALRAFDASNAGWVLTLGQQNYIRWKDPRSKGSVRLKSSRIDAEIDDVWVVDSEVPNILDIFEPAKISKTLVPGPFVDVELYEVGFYVQADGSCGYGFTDVGHRLDDCWVCF